MDNEFEDLSILRPVESGLACETFPILSAGASGSTVSSTTAITDESEKVHSKDKHETHQHHQHYRRSGRKSTVNQGGYHPRSRRVEHVELNLNAYQPSERGTQGRWDARYAYRLARTAFAFRVKDCVGGFGLWLMGVVMRRNVRATRRRRVGRVGIDGVIETRTLVKIFKGDGRERRPLEHDSKAAKVL